MGMLTTAVVGFDYLEVLDDTKIATGSEQQDLSFCFIIVKRSMNDLSSSLSTAELETVAIQTRMHTALKRTWISVLPPICKGCCVALERLGISPRRMRLFHSRGTRDLFRRLNPAIKEAKNFVHDLRRDSLWYVAFECRLCVNCSFCCCSRDMVLFREAYHQRWSTLWWQMLPEFYDRRKRTWACFWSTIALGRLWVDKFSLLLGCSLCKERWNSWS